MISAPVVLKYRVIDNEELITDNGHMKQILELLEMMKSLRDPEQGCPWDREQNFAGIAPFTIEEAYEVADAIARHDMDDLCLELGDLLLQVVYHAQLASEQGFFDFQDVVTKLNDKLTRRHPHVLGDADDSDPDARSPVWENIKKQERVHNTGNSGLLAGVAQAMPALIRARKLQARAATVGFDWQCAQPILGKIREEINEVEAEINAEILDLKKLEDEIGDLLFACVNLSRHFSLDAESAARKANKKFEQRFAFIEQALLQRDIKLSEASLELMESLWDEAKKNTTMD